MDNLAEMKRYLPEAAWAPTRQAIAGIVDDSEQVEKVSFTEVFGAPAYLIECVTDLAAVRPVDAGEGECRSLADEPSEWFDVAEWLDDGRFARFVTIGSVEGGPQYIVPRAIADQKRSVGLSVCMTAARMC
ncbi:hypothetical protein GCM10022268_25690 [Sphingomonas cynarae]|uniref:Uncharacterized protein n=2 Tax=Sphingomonas cynarae TaxID=930197 RepID=A0ABP7E938_9SPHN